MGEIIWQPREIYQPGNGFGIMLNSQFANDMFNSKLSQKSYKRMQELPLEFIGINDPEPYIFYRGTCLIKQINLDGGDGKWLSLESICGDRELDFNRPLEYSTHNLDYKPSSSDVVELMGLFDLWIEYSQILKDE